MRILTSFAREVSLINDWLIFICLDSAGLIKLNNTTDLLVWSNPNQSNMRSAVHSDTSLYKVIEYSLF